MITLLKFRSRFAVGDIASSVTCQGKLFPGDISDVFYAGFFPEWRHARHGRAAAAGNGAADRGGF